MSGSLKTRAGDELFRSLDVRDGDYKVIEGYLCDFRVVRGVASFYALLYSK